MSITTSVYLDKRDLICPNCGEEQYLAYSSTVQYTDNTRKFAKRNGLVIALECSECYYMKGKNVVQITYVDFDKDQQIFSKSLLKLVKLAYQV